MKHWLEIGTAIFAGLAAIFWFISTLGKLPAPGNYWSHTPDGDPFFVAMKRSVRLNAIAASCAAISAACAAWAALL